MTTRDWGACVKCGAKTQEHGFEARGGDRAIRICCTNLLCRFEAHAFVPAVLPADGYGRHPGPPPGVFDVPLPTRPSVVPLLPGIEIPPLKFQASRRKGTKGVIEVGQRWRFLEHASVKVISLDSGRALMDNGISYWFGALLDADGDWSLVTDDASPAVSVGQVWKRNGGDRRAVLISRHSCGVVTAFSWGKNFRVCLGTSAFQRDYSLALQPGDAVEQGWELPENADIELGINQVWETGAGHRLIVDQVGEFFVWLRHKSGTPVPRYCKSNFKDGSRFSLVFLPHEAKEAGWDVRETTRLPVVGDIWIRLCPRRHLIVSRADDRVTAHSPARTCEISLGVEEFQRDHRIVHRADEAEENGWDPPKETT